MFYHLQLLVVFKKVCNLGKNTTHNFLLKEAGMRTFGSPLKTYLFSFFKIMKKFVFNAKLINGKLKFLSFHSYTS